MPTPPVVPDPWPGDYVPEEGPDQLFHPDRPRFADASVLRRIDGQWQTVRGAVTNSDRTQADLRFPRATDGFIVGIVDGDAYAFGEPVSDSRFVVTLQAPPVPHGAEELEQVVAELREYARAIAELADAVVRLGEDGHVLHGFDDLDNIHLIDTRFTERRNDRGR